MNQSHTIRLPVHVIKQMNTVLRAMHTEGQLGREPSVAELASMLDIKPEEYAYQWLG